MRLPTHAYPTGLNRTPRSPATFAPFAPHTPRLPTTPTHPATRSTTVDVALVIRRFGYATLHYRNPTTFTPYVCLRLPAAALRTPWLDFSGSFGLDDIRLTPHPIAWRMTFNVCPIYTRTFLLARCKGDCYLRYRWTAHYRTFYTVPQFPHPTTFYLNTATCRTYTHARFTLPICYTFLYLPSVFFLVCTRCVYLLRLVRCAVRCIR